MPCCPTCKAVGKVINKKYKTTVTCSDCDGKGVISDKTLAFIEYYKHQKQLEAEIAVIENDSRFVEQYEQVKDV